MMSDKLEYKYEIIEGKTFGGYKHGDIVIPKRNSTAIVTYIDENDKENTLELGYISSEELYSEIMVANSINLNYTFAQNFDITNCFKEINKMSSSLVKINGLTACHAWFDGETIFKDFRCEDGDINFESAYFSNVAQFENIKFGEGVVFFDYATFENDTLFSNVYFGDGHVSFDGAYFVEGDILFTCCEIVEGEKSFVGTDFGETKVTFEQMFLGKHKTTFMGAVGNEVIFLDCTFENNDDFRFMSCKGLYFYDCTFDNAIDLRGSEEGVYESIIFDNVINNGLIKLKWTEQNFKDKIYKQKGETNYWNKALQFRMLKENFKKLEMYDEEDEAYYEFKRCQRISKKKGENLQIENKFLKRLIKGYRSIINIPSYILFELVGGYGTKPFRILLAMIFTWFIFAGIYAFIPFMSLSFSEAIKNIDKIQYLYFSVITFLTIGYGDIAPLNDITALITMIEGFLGVFFMAYFTGAFLRKLLR